jgi:hypothetical protein
VVKQLGCVGNSKLVVRPFAVSHDKGSRGHRACAIIRSTASAAEGISWMSPMP